MKLNKKSMLRICSLLSAALILIVSFAVPVSHAASYDFLDYMTNVQVYDDRNIVTFSLPCTTSRFDIRPSDMDIKETAFKDYLIYHFDDYDTTGTTYDLTISPSWTSSGRVNWLLLNNIPNNTEINVWLSLESYTGGRNDTATAFYPLEDYDWSSSGGRIFYYNGSEIVKTKGIDFGFSYTTTGNPPIHYFLGTGFLQDPSSPGAMNFMSVDRMYPNFYLNDLRFNEACDVKIGVYKYEVVLHIDTLVYTGQHGKLLDAINDKLVAQGLYIDPLTGDITHIKPGLGEDDNLLNDSNDKFKEDYSGFDSFDDALLGLQEIDVESFDTDIRNLVDPESFLAVISPFREIWNYQPFASILLIVVTLIVISLVFFGKRG